MGTIELIFSILIGSLGVIALIVVIRNPKILFANFPMLILKMPWLVFKNSFFWRRLIFAF